MKIQIQHIKIKGRKVWEWRIRAGRRITHGGFAATKQDAEGDAIIVLSHITTHPKPQSR